jgi:hypothetical protein
MKYTKSHALSATDHFACISCDERGSVLERHFCSIAERQLAISGNFTQVAESDVLYPLNRKAFSFNPPRNLPSYPLTSGRSPSYPVQFIKHVSKRRVRHLDSGLRRLNGGLGLLDLFSTSLVKILLFLHTI